MNLKTEIMNFLEANNWFSLESKENAEGVVNCYLKAYNFQLKQTAVMHSNCIDESPETRINVNKFDENDYYDGKFLK